MTRLAWFLAFAGLVGGPGLAQDSCDGPDLFERLAESAARQPERALACLGRLSHEAQREFIFRRSFAAAAASDAALATRYIEAAKNRPWVTSVGFYPLLEIARRSNADTAREIMIAAVRANPSVALRDLNAYLNLDFGPAAFDAAVNAAPDEAVGLATRNAPMAGLLRARGFTVLAALAIDDSLSGTERERRAVFAPRRVSVTEERFFPVLLAERLSAQGARAEFLDRALARTASLLFRWFEDRRPTLGGYTAAEIYALLAYGRAEEDDKLFGPVFDGLLLPKLHGAALPALRMRQFLAAAAEHNRLDAFLRAAGDACLERAVEGIETLEDALEVVEILDALPQGKWRSRIGASFRRDRPLEALLAARAGAAPESARFFRDTMRLALPEGPVTERMIFHADDDGVESFDSFRRSYAGDAQWRWEDRGDWVRVTGGRVTIVANKPMGEGQQQISRYLGEAGVEPAIFVHRGHSYHVDRSLRYLTNGARLVFLGSCRGLGVTADVLAIAPDAEVVATRAVGTAGVNDPLLKAINEALRTGSGVVEWPALWRTMRTKVGGAVFEDYLPPYANGPAQFAAAYYAWLRRL